jgi:colanic acid/amylovoran biosynthesis glycosyltransferase
MKIAFIVSSFPKLSETFILNQITGLIDLGHDVEIFALKKPKENKIHRDIEKYNLMIRVHYLTVPKSKIKRIFKALKIILKNLYRNPVIILKSLNFFKYSKKALFLSLIFYIYPFLNNNFDIIHCHFGPNGKFGALLKEIGVIKGKLVTSFHGTDMSKHILKRGKDTYKSLFKIGDAFMPISNYWKKVLIELGFPESKIVVHRMGIELEKFAFKKATHNNGITRFISIGRLVEKKGFEYAIRAIAILVKEFSDIEYNIIGDGPLRNNLDSLISILNLKNKVNILGYKTREEIIKLLRKSDVLLAPSVTAKNGDQEGIPIVIMEAMAIGLPVISSYHTGIPELVLDGKSGFLVSEKDVNGIAAKIKYLIKNPEKRIKLCKKARDTIEKYYNVDILNKKLVDIYYSLLKDK